MRGGKSSSAELTPSLVDRALATPVGSAYLNAAVDTLINDRRRNRFSSERVIRAYASAVDHAVWAYLQDSSLRRIIYRNYLGGFERFRILQAIGEVAAKLGPDE